MPPAEHTLDPAVSIDASVLVDGAPLDWIEPAVGLFLAPELVAVLERLGPLVRELASTVSMATAARGEAFPRDRATVLLASIVERWLAAQPGAGRWIEAARDARGRLRLSVMPEGMDGLVTPDRVTIRLRLSKGEARATVDLPLSSARGLAVIMDGLRGDYPPGVGLAMADRGVRAVLGALESIGGTLPREGTGEVFVPDGHDATVLTITHMGHAFLIMDGGSRRVLFDPVLHPWRDDFTVRPLSARQLGPVDAVFFTHHHADHLDLASLLMLPHRVPVYVPGGADQPLAPRCADYLRMLGFTDVREINAGDVAEVGDLRVQALTFTGEGREVVGFGANAYVAGLGRQRALIQADAGPDNTGRSIVSTGELARVVAAGGPIRTIFGRWWQDRAFLCTLSPLALVRPDVPSDRWLESVERCDCPADFLVGLIKACRARRFVAYAEGHQESFLPEHLVSGATATASLLWRPRAEVFRDIANRTGAETVAAQPFQQWRI